MPNGAGEPPADDAPTLSRETFPGHQILVEGQVGEPLGVASQHLGRHDDVARLQARVQPSGHAEADHTPDCRGIKNRQQLAQLLRVATAADHRQTRTGRNPGLLRQTSHDQDRPRVHLGRGSAIPCPQSHIPTPTTLLLVFRKFRYRANAQSGKNFEYP